MRVEAARASRSWEMSLQHWFLGRTARFRVELFPSFLLVFWGASLPPQSPRWAQAPRMAAMVMGDPSPLLVGEAYKRPAAAFCRPHFTCGASESLWSRSSTEHLISLVLVSEKLTHVVLHIVESKGICPAVLSVPCPAWLSTLHFSCHICVCGCHPPVFLST